MSQLQIPSVAPIAFQILYIKNLFFLYRGINMRYLGKVASILSLRADLEHVHVSVVCFYAYYVCDVNES